MVKRKSVSLLFCHITYLTSTNVTDGGSNHWKPSHISFTNEQIFSTFNLKRTQTSQSVPRSEHNLSLSQNRSFNAM